MGSAPEEQAAAEEGASPEGCPVEMYEGRRCGRPIRPAPTHDHPYVCLMHSRDPHKSNEEFQREFEAILRAAGEGVADFVGFVFPSANYEKREFKAACVFLRAKFMQGVSFRRATFNRGANFDRATFAHAADFVKGRFMLDVDFSRTRFMQDAVFSSTVFTRDAYFDGATVTGNAVFDLTTFTQTAGFSGTSFGQDANFDKAEFMRDAFFERATFANDARFDGAGFMQKAYFGATHFAQDGNFVAAMFAMNANFFNASFEQRANFTGATFAQDANFAGATFGGDASFTGTTCAHRISFERAKFLGRVEFRRTRFRHDKGGSGRNLPGAVFSLAEFAQPEKVVFDRVYLGQSLFYRCDVSRVNFSLVTWRRRKGSHIRMLFEQVVSLEAAKGLKPSKGSIDKRRYHLIAETYQQLKKNFDERKDYWTAGDFHYGEMEMKRMATKPQGSIGRSLGRLHFRVRQIGRIRRAAMRGLSRVGLGKWRARQTANLIPEHVGLTMDLVNEFSRWWHRHLSLVALYKYASQYGESYARPLVLLFLVVLLFTGLYPLAGLDLNKSATQPAGAAAAQQNSPPAPDPELGYGHFSEFVTKNYPGRKWFGRWAFFGNSLMTTLSVAGFQKEFKYEPSYPWGRVLALLELLLTSTLAALFFLAMRRQFRR